MDTEKESQVWLQKGAVEPRREMADIYTEGTLQGVDGISSRAWSHLWLCKYKILSSPLRLMFLF